MIKIILAPALALCLTACSSCTTTEQTQAVAAIQPTGACVADIVAATQGSENPIAIAATCSAALADVYQVVSELLAQEPSSSPEDAGAVLTADKRAHLLRIQQRAHSLMTDAGTTP